ncbi:App1 family protein [Agrococcus carbonis]|uniref:Phosphatidate phosphatase APP1 n=1 Tax=Agrococcus carbonis TaxID=684552 RepID=A0A1H1L445_9MICO|nr:phosphatase domain-containing protein [Agrococcus carbonis]SDR69167.1 Phosphatidate phosphatase APP1 [Agrococcus carbonis]
MDELDPLSRVPERIKHTAARVEDWVHEVREARALRAGRLPAIVAYPGYGGDGWVRVLARVLLVQPGAERSVHYENVRGWRSFTSLALNDIEVTIEAGGEQHVVVADRGGIVDAIVPARLEPGWREVTISVAGSVEVAAPVFVVDPATRFGVVSDIDDTVMVTSLPRPLLAAWNAFVLDEHARTPVPGMAVLYERIARQHPGSPFIYLSTGAWNAAPTLSRFLSRNLYPAGAMLLTDWGPTPDRFFRSGKEHKRLQLQRLAREFPDIAWLLVGDDGQHDEELYGEFASAHPRSVRAVAIRELSAQEAVLAGGRKHADTRSMHPWVWSPNGGGLARELGAIPELEVL